MPADRFSFLSLFRQGLRSHVGWRPAWRTPDPQPRYRVLIIGGGGHGLAAAYYLARTFNVTSVAVLEKGWLGGGNTGRNTTIIRSNYLQDESAALYNLSVQLFQTLSRELNYNIMYTPKGVLHLAHSHHDLCDITRRCGANHLKGIPQELWSPARIAARVPTLQLNGRFPVLGGLFQANAGTARHDAVAWAYARGADEAGVDILQNCEVTGFLIKNGQVQGVETTRGRIEAQQVALVTSGHAGQMAEMAGFRLPLVSVPLQALVSEPLKPVLDTVVMSNSVHAYMSQSDKGELVIGAGADDFISYAQRGAFHTMETCVSALCELFPFVSRLRLMRHWGGVVDMSYDRSPILSASPVKGLYLNVGWGTGGFKATAGAGYVLAASLSQDRPHPIAEPFGLDRFAKGALIDEGAAAAVAH